MSKTQRIVLIVAIVAAVIGGTLLILSFFLFGEEETTTETVNELPDVVDEVETETTEEGMPEVDPTTVSLEAQLKRIARNFTERYGSFSNQNDYQNIENLETFMTEGMQEETRTYVQQERQKDVDNSVYYGITTQVVTVETEAFNEEGGTMVVVLTTRRVETDTATGATESFEQDARLLFLKEGDRWLVDSFEFING